MKAQINKIKHWLSAIVASVSAVGQLFAARYLPEPMQHVLTQLARSEAGSIVNRVIFLVLGIVIVGAMIPALWPVAEQTGTAIQAMNTTGASGDFIKTMWPIGLIVAGLGLGIWLIFFALSKLGVFGAGKGKGGGGGW